MIFSWRKSESESLSLDQFFVIPWIVYCQAPLSMEFSRQEYWSGLPFFSPRELPHSWIDPVSPKLQEDSLLQSYQEICIIFKSGNGKKQGDKCKLKKRSNLGKIWGCGKNM